MKPVMKKLGPVVPQLSATKALTPEKAQQKAAHKPVKTSTLATPHSQHVNAKSQHYHAHVLGHAPARLTSQLNPNPSVTRANSTGRSFPGLAN